MTSPLRILLLEDNARDAELIHELLEADHFVCEITRVQTRAEFMAALEDGGIDLILADYMLPSFDGISALQLTQIAHSDLPFIFVSGSLGEEIAIEALKIGATDYVLKTRLSRLAPSVQRALREARERAERKKAEEGLRRSEMYRAAAERLSQTGSFGWNASTGEIHWSDGTYRIFECESKIKPNVQLVIDRTHPHDRAGLQEVLARAAMEGCEFMAEHRLLRPDCSVKYLQVVAQRLTGEDPNHVFFVGAVTDITERKQAEELRLEARVAERTRIARDLHDSLLQNFQGVLLQFRAALRLLAKQPDRAQDVLAHAIDEAAGAIKKGREAVQGLRASAEEFGDLAASIRSLGRDLASQHKGNLAPAVRVMVEGALERLPWDLCNEAFWIASEALRNAFDHACATQVEVELRYEPPQFRLLVRDDGQGIDPALLAVGGRQGHFGLRGMRERAALAGGELTVWSALGSGTEVKLVVSGAKASGGTPA